MDEIIPRARLVSLAAERVCLAGANEHVLPASTVYDNLDEFDPRFGGHMRDGIYGERIARSDAIDLVRIGEAIIHHGIDDVVVAGGVIVEEQCSPWIGDDALAAALSAPSPTECVENDTVIISRFGFRTWGHWLGELLPKMVMVENAFPGRFRFALPQTKGDPERRTLRESVSAYGFGEDRLVLLEPGAPCQLTRAWGVTPIWSDRAIHPAALDAMRVGLPGQLGHKALRRIAITRHKDAARYLENWPEIANILHGEGYKAVDIAALDFVDQVHAFLNAECVFGILGSGLTGLIYSPPGVQVLSVAPYSFGDWFFYALVAAQNGRYADVRGPIIEADPIVSHRGSFRIEPDRVIRGLAALKVSAAERFSEPFYLATYADVRQAVADRIFLNGYDHFNRFGRAEGRQGSPG